MGLCASCSSSVSLSNNHVLPSATLPYLLMCFVPQFTAATGIITLETVISPMRCCIQCTCGVWERLGLYKNAKECANKVRQCCEMFKKPVCRKHSHKNIRIN